MWPENGTRKANASPFVVFRSGSVPELSEFGGQAHRPVTPESSNDRLSEDDGSDP